LTISNDKKGVRKIVEGKVVPGGLKTFNEKKKKLDKEKPQPSKPQLSTT